MKITTELEQEDFDALHDTMLSVLGLEPTNDQIQKCWDELPFDIKGTAVQWGTSDSVFRDDFYVWLRDNKENILEIINDVTS